MTLKQIQSALYILKEQSQIVQQVFSDINSVQKDLTIVNFWKDVESVYNDYILKSTSLNRLSDLVARTNRTTSMAERVVNRTIAKMLRGEI